MTIQPIRQKLIDRARELGVTEIQLAFRGGSDEGYLDVEFQAPGRANHWQDVELTKFASQVEEWAWSVYRYSGAGEGNDYGDTIIYDLKNNKARSQTWCYEYKEDDVEDEGTFEVVGEDEVIDPQTVY
jgi:hypothetical protein